MREEEFMALYDEVHVRLFTFAVRRVPAHSAMDIVSESFLTIWEKRDECPPDLSRQVGWALTICRYKVLQELGRLRRKSHDNRFVADIDGFGSAGDDIAEMVGNRDVWGSVFQRLSAVERDLFDIAWLSNLSPAEGAAVFGIDSGAFNTRVSRLRSKIGELFEQAVSSDSDSDPIRGGS